MPLWAQVAELVDALASGASGRKAVEVRVFSWAPFLLMTCGGGTASAPPPGATNP